MTHHDLTPRLHRLEWTNGYTSRHTVLCVCCPHRSQWPTRAQATADALKHRGPNLGHPGTAWLRDVCWPATSTVLDGEAVAGDGHEGIQAVFEARNRGGWRDVVRGIRCAGA